MAARRLVVVMLVLLAISTLATALLPGPEKRRTTTDAAPGRKQPVKVPPRPTAAPLLLAARMQASGRQPKTLRIERGDQLRLDVRAPFGADVEIPGFGLTSTVTPSAAAQFDLLATSSGAFAVRIVDPAQLVGRVLVAKPGGGRCGVSRPAALPGRGSIRSCRHRETRSSPGGGRSAPRP